MKAKADGLAKRRPTKSWTALNRRDADSMELMFLEAHADCNIMGYRLMSADYLLGLCEFKIEWKDAEIARLKRLLRGRSSCRK